MKKMIALLLALVLTLSLCACAKKVDTDKLMVPTDPEKNAGAADNRPTGSEGQQTETDATGEKQEGEEPFDITELENYYQDLSEPQYVENQLTFQIFQAWYEEGDLVMDIHFINGHAEPVYNVWFDEIGIFNGDLEVDGEFIQGGMIAHESMGPVGLEEPIMGNTYQTARLRFRAEIEVQLVDLSLDLDPGCYSYDWGFDA